MDYNVKTPTNSRNSRFRSLRKHTYARTCVILRCNKTSIKIFTYKIVVLDAVISAKENIPVLEMKHSANINNSKYRSVTGTHSSKSSNRISPVSATKIERSSSNNKDLITTKDITGRREQNLDNKKIDTRNPEIMVNDKVIF